LKIIETTVVQTAVIKRKWSDVLKHLTTPIFIEDENVVQIGSDLVYFMNDQLIAEDIFTNQKRKYV